MYQNKKEKLYINELLDSPTLNYPSYYILSSSMKNNELLHSALITIHSYDFSHYYKPNNYEEIFQNLSLGAFPLYKEQYIIGYFGGKMMYIEPNGWRSMPLSIDVFDMDNWLIS